MKRHKLKIFFSLTSILIAALIYIHSVPKSISEEDKLSLQSIFESELVDASELSFEEQIQFIDQQVKTLHKNLAVFQPIAYNMPREPHQLFENGGGFCYDLSRSIEKQLMLSGFKTRHVAVYLNLKEYSFLKNILAKDVTSHSVCEVLTKNGWMAVDSNEPFYALDQNGEIYSFKDLRDLEITPSWQILPSRETSKFYMGKIEYVYGLYSRHGHFYAPYNPIPDFNFRELFYNF